MKNRMNSSLSSNHPGAKLRSRQRIESILSPKQQPRPLPSLLSLFFFYITDPALYLSAICTILNVFFDFSDLNILFLTIFLSPYFAQIFANLNYTKVLYRLTTLWPIYVSSVVSLDNSVARFSFLWQQYCAILYPWQHYGSVFFYPLTTL